MLRLPNRTTLWIRGHLLTPVCYASLIWETWCRTQTKRLSGSATHTKWSRLVHINKTKPNTSIYDHSQHHDNMNEMIWARWALSLMWHCFSWSRLWQNAKRTKHTVTSAHSHVAIVSSPLTHETTSYYLTNVKSLISGQTRQEKDLADMMLCDGVRHSSKAPPKGAKEDHCGWSRENGLLPFHSSD
jgi:hypothetical protein